MDIKAGGRRLAQSLEDLVQLAPWQGTGDDESLETNDGDGGEFGIPGATGDDEGVDEVGSLGELYRSVSDGRKTYISESKKRMSAYTVGSLSLVACSDALELFESLFGGLERLSVANVTQRSLLHLVDSPQ